MVSAYPQQHSQRPRTTHGVKWLASLQTKPLGVPSRHILDSSQAVPSATTTDERRERRPAPPLFLTSGKSHHSVPGSRHSQSCPSRYTLESESTTISTRCGQQCLSSPRQQKMTPTRPPTKRTSQATPLATSARPKRQRLHNTRRIRTRTTKPGDEGAGGRTLTSQIPPPP